MRFVVLGLWAALVATVAGGCSDAASHSSGSAAGTGFAAGSANEAERLLERMIAAYQQADAYADRGELRINFRREGRLFESKIPFSVVLARYCRMILKRIFHTLSQTA